MRIYATRRQCEQIVVAMMATFGSRDPEVLKLINTVNKVLLHQCERDKKHYIPSEAINLLDDKEAK